MAGQSPTLRANGWTKDERANLKGLYETVAYAFIGLAMISLSLVAGRSLETAVPSASLAAILISVAIFYPDIQTIVRFWTFDSEYSKYLKL